VFRRREVQADDVFEFLDELRIARDLEAADAVRFEAIGAPMPRRRANFTGVAAAGTNLIGGHRQCMKAIALNASSPPPERA